MTDADDLAVRIRATTASVRAPASLRAAIAAPACKERLRANTDELVARGGFGSPTIFVNGTDMYFGNDRLVLVDRALGEASRA